MSDNQDTGRRCPRCDCPDGHTQCDHCKVCPHADGPVGQFVMLGNAATAVQLVEPPKTIAILGDDGRTPLVTIHADGKLEYGPGYTPDEAALRFWDALRRLAPARCPACGHMGLEAP